MKSMLRFILLSLVPLQLAACGQPLAQKAAAIPTPQPTATLMAGWKRFENKGVSIALPDTFVGGNLTADDQKTIAEKVEKLGDDFKRAAEMMKQNPDAYILYIMDTEPNEAGGVTNVMIAREKTLSAIDPETYVAMVKKQLPASFKVTAQDNITLFGEPATRLAADLSIANNNVSEVMYVFRRGTNMYTVTYGTDSATFEEKRLIFEQSIQSLAVNLEP